MCKESLKINNMKCADAPVSIDQYQMKRMITEIRRIEKIFGKDNLGIRKSEKNITSFRRFTR